MHKKQQQKTWFSLCKILIIHNIQNVIFSFVSLRTYSENDCTTVAPPEPCLSPTKDLVYSKTAKQCLEEISGRMSTATCAHTHLHTVKHKRARHTPHTQHIHSHRNTGTDSLCRPLVPCCYHSKKRSDMTGGQRPALFGRPSSRMCCLFALLCISLCVGLWCDSW